MWYIVVVLCILTTLHGQNHYNHMSPRQLTSVNGTLSICH